MKKFKFILLFFSLVFTFNLCAQVDDTSVVSKPFQQPNVIDYNRPHTYILANIVITGTNFYDKSVLQILTGLTIGQKIKIPSDDISKTIMNLWRQKLFDDIKIRIMDIQEDKITLEIYLREKPRLSTFSIKGLRKGKANSLREDLTIKSGQIITENMLKSVKNEIKKFFTEKGFLNAKSNITQETDNAAKNTARLKIEVDRGPKIKIYDITFSGNSALKDNELRKLLKKTKRKRRFLAKSRFIEEDYKDDKQHIIEKYLSMGYRDVEITSDSIYRHDEKTMNIHINISEGRKYFFRNIAFIGNTKYSTELLKSILNIKRGDVYDQSTLDQRINMNQNGLDISTLYMDDGYLFFNIMPVEVLVENDSIDLEVRIHEGEQARINRVTVKGNTKTSDHVVLRELRTKPGQLFSRTDVTRSLRELGQLGYFHQEGLGVNPVPHPESGTVDIEYKVEERPNDQIELSAGWGAISIVGTLGLTLNNFSTQRMFNKKAWSPVPSGDGQRLSLRAQTNGTYYQSYSASFMEPWLGGRRPNALSVSSYYSIQSNGYPIGSDYRASLNTFGFVVGLGKRLKWPDDWFVINYQTSYQRYENYASVATGQSYLATVPPGGTNNISFKITVGRNSTQPLIYPVSGSNLSMSVQFTPPYSLFSGIDYSTLDASQKLHWLEFHKWKFDATTYTTLFGGERKLVLMSRANFGFIGYYNPNVGMTPFERFWVGGSGLLGFSLDGRELIALRGYPDNSLTPTVNVNGVPTRTGGTIYNRFTMELRYPISTNPQATVFPLVFLEAGGAWLNFKDYNPYEIYRSAGVGVRIFLPMFGMIGLDWGYGFDPLPFSTTPSAGNFHFLIGQQF
ncbi:MAG: outer membrane protein assembly factor BamA [Bacteroidia bacterium]